VKIGIGLNEWAQTLPAALAIACKDLGINYQIIDFSNFSEVDVTHLAPALLYLKPKAFALYKELEAKGVKALNSVGAIDIADDKAATYRALRREQVPQLETEVILLELTEMQRLFRQGGTVYKRTHGGQGRWVRLARQESEIAVIYKEFLAEGPGEVIAQPFISEANGQTIRVIVTGGRILASALRSAEMDFRSNISLGGSQVKYELSEFEAELALDATRALGLGHAGVDLILTNQGARVLEVNACPDFTSMKEISDIDIAQEVIKTLLLK
jgi:ribosomal protein S6--L-glutamate ligase